MYTPNLKPEQNEATTPRVPKNYAISPRVQTQSETQDATEFIYPKRGIWNEHTKEPEKPPSPKMQTDKPRQSLRIQELLQRPNADTGNLRSTPAQNTRSKTTQERPIEKLCEMRTIDQELFLACIQTYTKVTHKPVNPAHLAQRKFPTK